MHFEEAHRLGPDIAEEQVSVVIHRAAGDVLRALAWLGPTRAAEALRTLERKLPKGELQEIAAARSRLPTWMAQEVSTLARDA